MNDTSFLVTEILLFYVLYGSNVCFDKYSLIDVLTKERGHVYHKVLNSVDKYELDCISSVMTEIFICYVEPTKYLLENTLSLPPHQLKLNFDSAN